MEYVEGCALSSLLTKNRDRRPAKVIVPIVLDVLSGLHAAHTRTDDDGTQMHLVHRDVSPQNVLVDGDGAARLTDFGVAKASSRINSTRPGELKGKLAFMSPEQILGQAVDARSDVFAIGVMLWMALTGRRLFLGDNDAETLSNVLTMEIPKPSSVGLRPSAFLDGICMKALERDPAKRFATALQMEEALREAAQRAGLVGSRRDVADWVSGAFGAELTERRKAIRTVVDEASMRRPVAAAPASAPSGLRMIPQVGSTSSPELGSPLTPTTSATGEIADGGKPEGKHTTPPPPHYDPSTLSGVAPALRKRSPLVAVLAIGAVAVTAVALVLATRTSPEPEPPRPAAAPNATATATTPPATADPRPAETTATKPAPATATASSTPIATAVAKPPVPVVQNRAWVPPPPAPRPAAAPPATTSAKPTSKVPIVHDEF
jgi:serine/threonine-protein kinase